MTPADVRQLPVTTGPPRRGSGDFALRAPLPVGVYPDAPTALRAALVAAPAWLRVLAVLPALLRGLLRGAPPRRWGAYAARVGDRLGPLRVVESGPHRVTLAASGGGLDTRLEIHVSDGALTARGGVRCELAVGRRLLAPMQRMLVRALLARAAGLLAARAQPWRSGLANTAEPVVANTMA